MQVRLLSLKGLCCLITNLVPKLHDYLFPLTFSSILKVYINSKDDSTLDVVLDSFSIILKTDFDISAESIQFLIKKSLEIFLDIENNIYLRISSSYLLCCIVENNPTICCVNLSKYLATHEFIHRICNQSIKRIYCL